MNDFSQHLFRQVKHRNLKATGPTQRQKENEDELKDPASVITKLINIGRSPL
jgi:hypothetical protein